MQLLFILTFYIMLLLLKHLTLIYVHIGLSSVCTQHHSENSITRASKCNIIKCQKSFFFSDNKICNKILCLIQVLNFTKVYFYNREVNFKSDVTLLQFVGYYILAYTSVQMLHVALFPFSAKLREKQHIDSYIIHYTHGSMIIVTLLYADNCDQDELYNFSV